MTTDWSKTLSCRSLCLCSMPCGLSQNFDTKSATSSSSSTNTSHKGKTISSGITHHPPKSGYCERLTEGKNVCVSVNVCLCICIPVIIRHSLCSNASVKRRETMSSGLIMNLISSWTSPCPVTPPPTNLFAKST